MEYNKRVLTVFYTRFCSVGANLTFLKDLHWNPQLESQALDRIYHVGQERPVFIHQFITRSTIEEKVKGLQMGKMALAREILSGYIDKEKLTERSSPVFTRI